MSPIQPYEKPILREKSGPVETIDDRIREIAKVMTDLFA
jgi:peptide deformylase